MRLPGGHDWWSPPHRLNDSVYYYARNREGEGGTHRRSSIPLVKNAGLEGVSNTTERDPLRQVATYKKGV